MYNEQIEALISAALADGMLTEKEKQILFKKAQSQGIDLDEFEMVLDARLVELEKVEKAKAAASAPKSNKVGDVKKCPNCGAIVQSYLGACPECGYGFEEMTANLTSRKLAEKLDKIAKEWDDKISAQTNEDEKWALQKGKEQALAQAIMTTPLPNTKADLFEFMTMTQAAFLSTSTPYHSAAAYNTKYQESLLKAKSLFARDDIFSSIINEEQNVQTKYLKIHKKQPKVGLKPETKVILSLVGFIVAGVTLLGILTALGIM
ncbi:MAG: hypothetical protein J6C57_03290 [Paludibacteraceae bacterium]|nr:hypothetical protein [Paludibacteraceae bacterium]